MWIGSFWYFYWIQFLVLENGFASTRPQTIIYTDDDPVQRRIYVIPGDDDLNDQVKTQTTNVNPERNYIQRNICNSNCSYML